MKVFWWELYFCIKSWSPSSPKLLNFPNNTKHVMWKWRVGGLYTAWDWHEPTRTARWRLRAQWGVKNQKRPPSLSHYTDGAPSPPRDNTEASRHRPKFTSPQKVAADKSMSGFPSQNLRHHASQWCTSRCLVSQQRRQAQTRSFFILDLICFVV